MLKGNSERCLDSARHDKKSRRRLLLRDVSETGDVAHLPANHGARARLSCCHRSKTRKRSGRFPFDKIDIVPKPALHFLRRFWFRQVRDKPWQISSGELRALLEVLEKTDARLLHIYFGHIAVHLLPLIRAWPRPSIVSFHGADVMVDMNKPAYREATRQMLDAVKLVLVRSESLRSAVVDLGCDEKKIEVQRTGIPLDEFPFRERNFPPSDSGAEWRFVQAGRLIEKKGLPVTLRAFASFLKRYPNATLTIAGEGPLLGHLQELARELKIDNRVSFTGFISQEQLRGPLLWIAHFPAPERDRPRRKSGGNSKFNAGSDGQRAASVRDRAWRDS